MTNGSKRPARVQRPRRSSGFAWACRGPVGAHALTGRTRPLHDIGRSAADSQPVSAEACAPEGGPAIHMTAVFTPFAAVSANRSAPYSCAGASARPRDGSQCGSTIAWESARVRPLLDGLPGFGRVGENIRPRGR